VEAGPIGCLHTLIDAKLSHGASIAHFKDLWAARVPLKIKIFSWQMALDRLPSRLNVAAKRGPGNGRCALCNAEEDATHIFFFLFTG
jgi:hypothetical protein